MVKNCALLSVFMHFFTEAVPKQQLQFSTSFPIQTPSLYIFNMNSLHTWHPGAVDTHVLEAD